MKALFRILMVCGAVALIGFMFLIPLRKMSH